MFELKQKVWCVIFGAGVVRNILANDTRFPLVVEFDGKLGCYTLDGKYALNTAQALFPYPVEVIKKVTKPSINWDHVHGKYNYLATDDMGNAWLYGKEPTIDDDNGCWDVELGEFALADTHVSYATGTCDWKESLVKRPEGDNHGG